MRVAHEGVPPQPLPGGLWQGPAESAPGWPWQAPSPVAEAFPPPAATVQAPRGRGDSLVPPGLIPTAGAGQSAARPRARNFFDTLFGGG